MRASTALVWTVVGVAVGIFAPFPPLLGGCLICFFGAGPFSLWFISIVSRAAEPRSILPEPTIFFLSEVDPEGED